LQLSARERPLYAAIDIELPNWSAVDIVGTLKEEVEANVREMGTICLISRCSQFARASQRVPRKCTGNIQAAVDIFERWYG
jgi:hypothetical protein